MGARELRWSFFVPAPVKRVALTLCSEAYAIAEAERRADVASATYGVIRQADPTLEFEVVYVEYARTRTGGIDRSRTTHGRTVSSWDGRGQLSWRYESESNARITISGVYRLAPERDGTRVENEIRVEVRVPLIGTQIAKLVAREIEQGRGEMQQLLIRQAASSGI
jgi:hypothetical protein